MKKKLFSLLVALVLCAAFFIPAYAQEAEDGEEITITLDGERVPPNLVIIPPTVEELLNQQEPEESAQPSNGAGVINTPSGAGTLLEDVCQSEVNRQFITVQTRAGNVFYIIIDNDRNGQNVYFLNAVDDFDLLTFSDDFPDGVIEAYEELKEEIITAQNTENTDNNEEKPPTKPDNSESTEESAPRNNTQIYIIGGVGALFIGGFIYFKKFKGKGNKNAVTTPLCEGEDEEEESEEL
jgi:hypothetical protein